MSEEKKSENTPPQNSSSSFSNYLAIENVGGAHFHPKENKIVFVYNVTGLNQVYETIVTEGQQSWPRRLTYSEDRCTNPRYLSDGSIIYVSDAGGNENFQIFMIDPISKQNVAITTDLKAKHRLSLITDDYFYYAANINDKAKFDIYRRKIPLLNNKPELIYSPKKGLISLHCVSESDSNIMIFCNTLSNVHSDLILYDFQNKKETNLTSQMQTQNNKTYRFIGYRFLDDQNVLVVTDFDNDFRRPIVLNIETKKICSFKQIEDTVKWDYVHFEFNKNASKNKKWMYFTQNEHGYSVLYRSVFESNGLLTDLQNIDLPMKCVLSSGDQRTSTQCMHLNCDGTLLAFSMTNSVEPKNMFVANVSDNKFKCWRISNVSTPGINVQHFVDCTLESFKSFDGLEVHYFRYFPRNYSDKPLPVIFMIHGGPESQWKPTFKTLVQFYCAAGFAVIAPNIRGSRGYGRTYMDLDNVEKRLDSVRDVSELARYIAKNDADIDGTKMIVYGGSYGGFVVLSALTEYPDIFIAGVDIVGISSFVTFLQNTADWRRPLRESEYGSLKDDMEVLKRISPINKIDKICVPLFIIQGDNDERVPLSESLQIYEILKKKKLNTVLMRFDDEGHGVTKLKNKIKAYGQVLPWLLDIVNPNRKL